MKKIFATLAIIFIALSVYAEEFNGLAGFSFGMTMQEAKVILNTKSLKFEIAKKIDGDWKYLEENSMRLYNYHGNEVGGDFGSGLVKDGITYIEVEKDFEYIGQKCSLVLGFYLDKLYMIKIEKSLKISTMNETERDFFIQLPENLRNKYNLKIVFEDKSLTNYYSVNMPKIGNKALFVQAPQYSRRFFRLTGDGFQLIAFDDNNELIAEKKKQNIIEEKRKEEEREKKAFEKQQQTQNLYNQL